VVLVTPQANSSPMGIVPRYRVFTIVGIYSVSSDVLLNENTAFINLKDAQTLYQYGNAVSALRLRVVDLYAAPEVARNLNTVLPDTFFANDWTQKYGTFFKAIAMEKTMMFIILLLIVGIAAFNLVSTLVMVVNDKRSDIAILRTMGATPGFIMRVFMLQGFIIGSLGTLLGIILGILLSLNVTSIVNFIQNTFGVRFISSSVYFIDYVPSQLQWLDILHISLAALLLSFLATIYPARTAAKTQPAEALRYE
jgi:lipoprotein-releasing system permease protein